LLVEQHICDVYFLAGQTLRKSKNCWFRVGYLDRFYGAFQFDADYPMIFHHQPRPLEIRKPRRLK